MIIKSYWERTVGIASLLVSLGKTGLLQLLDLSDLLAFLEKAPFF